MSVAVPIVRSNSQALQLMEEGKKDWFESRSEPRDEPLFVNDGFNHLDHYKHLNERLQSFENPDWPSGVPVTTEELARAGWFYVGRDDRVQCPWCGGCVFNWVPGDSALGEHRRHFPHCDFVKDHLANAFKPLSKSPQTQPIQRQNVTSENWRDIEAVKAARDLDLPDDVIELVVRKLLRNKSKFL